MTVASQTGTSIPLVVDLDGTFLKTDLLWESVLAALKSDPRRLLAALVSLGHGRAAFKARLIDMAALDVKCLPVEQGVLEFIRREKSAGRRIILATGSTNDAAQAVARCYPLFDEVMTTDGVVNLVGRHKGLELEKRFGKGGFDYVGNELADLDVWSRCHTAYVCNSHWWTRRLLAGRHPRCVPLATTRSGGLAALARGARVHQWAKNLLILAPFVAAHQPLTLAAALRLALGFLAFSLTSSAVYLLNDLIDVEHDRRHPVKQRRPLASGHLSIPAAIGGVALLVASVFLLVQPLPARFTLLLVGYFAATCLYSLWLKRVVLADVIMLAVLYVWRVGAGSALVNVPLSRWFMVFSIFLFFSLALVKRCSELAGAKTRGVEPVHGRGYWVKDLVPLSQFGAVSGLIAALVYCLYIASPEVSMLYSRPEVLWFGLPVLLFWICRLWLLAGRGEVQEDPLLFALTDRVSYAVGTAMGIVILVAA